MIRKVLEAFFRHKLLVLLPPFLIPAIVTPIAIMVFPPQYASATSIWVDRPSYLDYKDTAGPFTSPVQTQSSRLADLLHTRAFVDDVASRTSLASLVGSPAGEQRIADLITKGVTIGATAADPHAVASDHLVVLTVQASNGPLAEELCQAIIDAFQDKNTADQSDQAGVAVDFYQSRLQDAQQVQDQASQNLRRYVAAHQGSDNSATDSSSSLPATLLDPKLGELQSNFQQAQANVNAAQTALLQAQRDASASAQGQQLGFQILDPPQLATSPTPQTKKIIIYPIAALIVGLGFSSMLLVLLVASDRSIRSEADLTSNLRILGMVPMLQLKRLPKELRSVGTRRAMGAVAGTALPAPSMAD
ncbi:MAG: hypothetical protein JOZ87_30890 [Chloroflexi bacterium]|nr:hypothetical protein [Chloroflexota bacterium]